MSVHFITIPERYLIYSIEVMYKLAPLIGHLSHHFWIISDRLRRRDHRFVVIAVIVFAYSGGSPAFIMKAQG